MRAGWSRPALAAALLGLLAAAMGLRALTLSARHPFPVYDEAANLHLARVSAARGGLGPLLRGYLDLSWREDNASPLHIALLVPFMRQEPQDFTRGKLGALAYALFFMLAVAAAARRAGRELWLPAAAWAAFSPTVAVYAHALKPDLLFSGLYALAVALAPCESSDRRRWLLFGALAGLAWLAKGNGHFLLLIPLAAALARGRGAWREPALPLAWAGFAAVSWPLLWRNLRVWGDPFHQLHQKAIWVDNGNDYLALALSAEWERVGAAWYWHGHTLREMTAHLVHGLGEAAASLSRAMAVGPRGETVELLTGGPLLALAAFGLLRAWHRGERDRIRNVLAPGIALWLAFAWLAKTGPSYVRFHLPLAAALLPFALEAGRELAARFLPRQPAWGAMLAAAALATAIANGTSLRRDPLGSWATPPFWGPTSAWLRANAPAGYLLDNASLYSNWDVPPDGRRGVPLRGRGGDAAVLAERFGVRHAVVDSTLPGSAPPPGWGRCFSAPGVATPLVVYGLDCRAER